MNHAEHDESIGSMLASIAAALREVSEKLDVVAARVQQEVPRFPADDDLPDQTRIRRLETWAFHASQDISRLSSRLDTLDGGEPTPPPVRDGRSRREVREAAERAAAGLGETSEPAPAAATEPASPHRFRNIDGARPPLERRQSTVRSTDHLGDPTWPITTTPVPRAIATLEPIGAGDGGSGESPGADEVSGGRARKGFETGDAGTEGRRSTAAGRPAPTVVPPGPDGLAGTVGESARARQDTGASNGTAVGGSATISRDIAASSGNATARLSAPTRSPASDSAPDSSANRPTPGGTDSPPAGATSTSAVRHDTAPGPTSGSTTGAHRSADRTTPSGCAPGSSAPVGGDAVVQHASGSAFPSRGGALELNDDTVIEAVDRSRPTNGTEQRAYPERAVSLSALGLDGPSSPDDRPRSAPSEWTVRSNDAESGDAMPGSAATSNNAHGGVLPGTTEPNSTASITTPGRTATSGTAPGGTTSATTFPGSTTHDGTFPGGAPTSNSELGRGSTSGTGLATTEFGGTAADGTTPGGTGSASPTPGSATTSSTPHGHVAMSGTATGSTAPGDTAARVTAPGHVSTDDAAASGVVTEDVAARRMASDGVGAGNSAAGEVVGPGAYGPDVRGDDARSGPIDGAGHPLSAEGGIERARPVGKAGEDRGGSNERFGGRPGSDSTGARGSFTTPLTGGGATAPGGSSSLEGSPKIGTASGNPADDSVASGTPFAAARYEETPPQGSALGYSPVPGGPSAGNRPSGERPPLGEPFGASPGGASQDGSFRTPQVSDPNSLDASDTPPFGTPLTSGPAEEPTVPGATFGGPIGAPDALPGTVIGAEDKITPDPRAAGLTTGGPAGTNSQSGEAGASGNSANGIHWTFADDTTATLPAPVQNGYSPTAESNRRSDSIFDEFTPRDRLTTPAEPPARLSTPQTEPTPDPAPPTATDAAGITVTGTFRAFDIERAHVDKLQAMLDELKRSAGLPPGPRDVFGPPPTDPR